MIYYIADTHFGHENIIELCHRPFSSVEEMDEQLIKVWNERVSSRDMVIVLGDLFYRHKDPERNDRKASYWPWLKAEDHALNAGVDINGFKPVIFEEMLENNRRFKALE